MTEDVRIRCSEPHGATQYFVEQNATELQSLALPAYAIENIDDCSSNSSFSPLEVLRSCSFSLRPEHCRPSHYFAIVCTKVPPTPSPPPPTPEPESKWARYYHVQVLCLLHDEERESRREVYCFYIVE